MKQPSGAASVSADTMMNSYRQPSHRKELFSCRTFHSQERERPFYTPAELDLTQTCPYGPAAIIVECSNKGKFLVSH